MDKSYFNAMMEREEELSNQRRIFIRRMIKPTPNYTQQEIAERLEKINITEPLDISITKA